MNRDGSVADPSQIASAIRKMQEDPLFVIKKKEAENHKSLVDNPLIRERVRQMMRAEKGHDNQSSAPMKYADASRRNTDADRGFRAYSRKSRSRSRSPPRSRRDDYERNREYNTRQDYRSRESDNVPRHRRRSRSRSPSSPRYRRR